MNSFALMARFNGWANGVLYGSVAELSEEAYKAERKAFFGSIHNTLNHLLVVDRLWAARIEEVEHGIQSLDQILFEDFESLRAARDQEDKRLIALVERLGDEELATPVAYRRMTNNGTNKTRRDHMLLTLFNHQTHHRGQVHALLTQQDVSPPPLDVIDFLEEIGLS
ncbi:MAG: DinB family protein [Proteobacteria bacterium]|nr:DinB family protein [Pseudomonadota bacterium]